MTSCGFRLALERAQLPPDLAQEVLYPQEVALRRVEAALGLFLATAELQDPCRFLDDRPTLLRAGVQHGVDLALTHDDVLLATDAGVAEQFLDIEQAAGNPIDRVFALARAEQRAADADLAELHGEHPIGVVDGEGDLRPSERGAFVGAVEDDVVHLLAADRAGGLRTEHPCDCIDHVGLARTVRADHDGDARLELERGGVCERLETLEGERLEEHGGFDPIASGHFDG
ncbi:unannotated protein [freshwater metagenome]|uniref:Unannotated protein n=1 Tax=freshwater metagenome TaxID=449393 RepID=A0A6J7A420_9ZZZZ